MKLYVLTSDGGDGSRSVQFVLDETVLHRLDTLWTEGVMDSENGWGVDGDGFTYSEITVPDGSTPESLGISIYSLITHSDIDEFVEE